MSNLHKFNTFHPPSSSHERPLTADHPTTASNLDENIEQFLTRPKSSFAKLGQTNSAMEGDDDEILNSSGVMSESDSRTNLSLSLMEDPGTFSYTI